MVDNKVKPIEKPVHVLATLKKIMIIWQIWPVENRMPFARLILLATYTLVVHVPMVLGI